MLTGPFETFAFATFFLTSLWQAPKLLILWILIYTSYVLLSIAFTCLKKSESRIKIAGWEGPSSRSALFSLEVDTTDCEEILEKLNANRGPKAKIGLLHVIEKGIRVGMDSHPEKGIRKIIFNKIVGHSQAKTTILVDINNGEDLTQTFAYNTDSLSIREIAEQLRGPIKRLKTLQCKNYLWDTKIFSFINVTLVILMSKANDILTYSLCLSNPLLSFNYNYMGNHLISYPAGMGLNQLKTAHFNAVSISYGLVLNSSRVGSRVKNGKIGVGRSVKLEFSLDPRYDWEIMRDIAKGIEKVATNVEKYL